MNYVTCWTLMRGVIDPPEPVDAVTQFEMERAARAASFERDPPMSQQDRWFEESHNYGYRKRRVA